MMLALSPEQGGIGDDMGVLALKDNNMDIMLGYMITDNLSDG